MSYTRSILEAENIHQYIDNADIPTLEKILNPSPLALTSPVMKSADIKESTEPYLIFCALINDMNGGSGDLLIFETKILIKLFLHYAFTERDAQKACQLFKQWGNFPLELEEEIKNEKFVTVMPAHKDKATATLQERNNAFVYALFTEPNNINLSALIFRALSEKSIVASSHLNTLCESNIIRLTRHRGKTLEIELNYNVFDLRINVMIAYCNLLLSPSLAADIKKNILEELLQFVKSFPVISSPALVEKLNQVIIIYPQINDNNFEALLNLDNFFDHSFLKLIEVQESTGLTPLAITIPTFLLNKLINEAIYKKNEVAKKHLASLRKITSTIEMVNPTTKAVENIKVNNDQHQLQKKIIDAYHDLLLTQNTDKLKKEELTETLLELEKLATEDNYADAYRLLGCIHGYGKINNKPDHQKAKEYFEKAKSKTPASEKSELATLNILILYAEVLDLLTIITRSTYWQHNNPAGVKSEGMSQINPLINQAFYKYPVLLAKVAFIINERVNSWSMWKRKRDEVTQAIFSLFNNFIVVADKSEMLESLTAIQDGLNKLLEQHPSLLIAKAEIAQEDLKNSLAIIKGLLNNEIYQKDGSRGITELRNLFNQNNNEFPSPDDLVKIVQNRRQKGSSDQRFSYSDKLYLIIDFYSKNQAFDLTLLGEIQQRFDDSEKYQKTCAEKLVNLENVLKSYAATNNVTVINQIKKHLAESKNLSFSTTWDTFQARILEQLYLSPHFIHDEEIARLYKLIVGESMVNALKSKFKELVGMNQQNKNSQRTDPFTNENPSQENSVPQDANPESYSDLTAEELRKMQAERAKRLRDVDQGFNKKTGAFQPLNWITNKFYSDIDLELDVRTPESPKPD